eukprot:TRINITY_DN2045_c0_g1_i1.p1 TRINITY_DN2045_c0_g1~~TRINITY_DN2045_c0_g1_i1.p1  ORF type:complete len:341 (-),score=126.55 TRINITY_DN2045_c0_g1_i1:84-1106(-)
MAHYTGTSRDSFRILQLTKQREEALQASRLQTRKSDLPPVSKVSTLADKFSKEEDLTFSTIKEKTYGIHELSEYQEKVREAKLRVELETQKREEALVDKTSQKQVKKRARPQLLSFGDDEEEDGEGDDEDEEKDGDEDGDEEKRFQGAGSGERMEKKRKVIGKNPEVDTTFLPDTERERELQETTRKLAMQWEEEQEKIKQQSFVITYSYWDGRGHRRSMELQKGMSIGKFLEKVQQEFKELSRVSVENLMFVKEDLIIPHHYTFYEMIVTKARGKSGPLFDFGVKDDLRLLADATVEKEDTHAGKVVDRHWYDKNKHIFPANRWEVFDPNKKFDKYTIR